MKQNGKVRGARGVKTDARSTAAGILKAARRHGALAGAAARPRTAPSSVALRERDALHAAPRLAAAAPNRCFAGCRTARWRRRRGAAASALPPRPWATTIARRTCRLCRDRGGAVRLSHRLSRPLSRPTPALFVATPMDQSRGEHIVGRYPLWWLGRLLRHSRCSDLLPVLSLRV